MSNRNHKWLRAITEGSPWGPGVSGKTEVDQFGRARYGHFSKAPKPQWFGEEWDRYLAHWEEGNRAAVELRCPRDRVSPDRIVAKAMFPNGTDPDFLGDLIGSWAEVESLSHGN